MPLQPKKTKYRKSQKGRIKPITNKGSRVAFGSFGLKAMAPRYLTSSQIEASRVAISRALKRKGKLWIRVFPQKPITSKGSEVPMGGGKGGVSGYVFPVSAGRIIFELDGVEESLARQAFNKAADKLPFKTSFVRRTSL